jgi:hypothetical protein
VRHDGEAASIRGRRAHAGLSDPDHRQAEQTGQVVGTGVAKGAHNHGIGALGKLPLERAHSICGLVELCIARDERGAERCGQPFDLDVCGRALARDLDHQRRKGCRRIGVDENDPLHEKCSIRCLRYQGGH